MTHRKRDRERQSEVDQKRGQRQEQDHQDPDHADGKASIPLNEKHLDGAVSGLRCSHKKHSPRAIFRGACYPKLARGIRPAPANDVMHTAAADRPRGRRRCDTSAGISNSAPWPGFAIKAAPSIFKPGTRVIGILGSELAAAHTLIAEAQFERRFRIENIPEVDDGIARHGGLDGLEVERPEFVPLG